MFLKQTIKIKRGYPFIMGNMYAQLDQNIHGKTLIIRETLFSQGYQPVYIQETLFSRIVSSSSLLFTLEIIGEDCILASLHCW